MGNQVRLAELPPLEIIVSDRARTTGKMAAIDKEGFAGMRDNMVRMVMCDAFDHLHCRERQLREALAELRAANERAAENFNDALAYAEAAKWQRERAEAAEAKLAAVSEPKE